MEPILHAAVDLGGTHFTAILGDANGRILAQDKQSTRSHEGPEAVLARLADTIESLAAAAGRRPARLGLGVPGLVDAALGVTRFLPNLATQWRDVPVRGILERSLDCEVFLLNDARAATLGEQCFGHGRDVSTFVFFTLGTGVGGGIVVDGRLRLGPLGAAGEIGHIEIDPAGPPCGCGSRGCLETFVSGPALVGEAVRLVRSGNAPYLLARCGNDLNRLDPALLGAAARDGESAARRVVERAGEALGLAAAGLVTALAPELIVLGGGVAGLADLLAPAMHRVIGERVRMFPVETLRIAASALGDRAGVLGALAVALHGPALFTAASRDALSPPPVFLP